MTALCTLLHSLHSLGLVHALLCKHACAICLQATHSTMQCLHKCVHLHNACFVYSQSFSNELLEGIVHASVCIRRTGVRAKILMRGGGVLPHNACTSVCICTLLALHSHKALIMSYQKALCMPVCVSGTRACGPEF